MQEGAKGVRVTHPDVHVLMALQLSNLPGPLQLMSDGEAITPGRFLGHEESA